MLTQALKNCVCAISLLLAEMAPMFIGVGAGYLLAGLFGGFK